MNRNERIQHFLLLTSFIVLVLTGFGLRFPESWWVKQIVDVIGDNAFEARGIVHRVASVVLVLVSVYHIIYVFYTKEGKKLLKDFMPGKKDIAEFKFYMLWLLGKHKSRPQFGRFSYIEKMEYWAVVWGTVIMGVTGFILWFKDFFFPYLSNTGIDVASEIHFYEALLATLAIIVWHFYFVFFNPDVAPMNKAWITGEHPEKIFEDDEYELNPLPGDNKFSETDSNSTEDENISDQISIEEKEIDDELKSESTELVNESEAQMDSDKIKSETHSQENKNQDEQTDTTIEDESTDENTNEERDDESDQDNKSSDTNHTK